MSQSIQKLIIRTNYIWIVIILAQLLLAYLSKIVSWLSVINFKSLIVHFSLISVILSTCTLLIINHSAISKLSKFMLTTILLGFSFYIFIYGFQIPILHPKQIAYSTITPFLFKSCCWIITVTLLTSINKTPHKTSNRIALYIIMGIIFFLFKLCYQVMFKFNTYSHILSSHWFQYIKFIDLLGWVILLQIILRLLIPSQQHD